MQALIAVLAAIAGIIIGYLLRQVAARAERAAAENERVQSARRAAELAAELNQARALAESRAGFESLAAERQSLIDRLTAERDQANAALGAKTESERGLSARISQLEADLRNERQNLAEKVALLESAKKSLADQFQALASEILDQKSKTFSEAS